MGIDWNEQDNFHSYAYDAIWAIAHVIYNLIELGGGDDSIEEILAAATSSRMQMALERISFLGATVSESKYSALIGQNFLIYCFHSLL